MDTAPAQQPSQPPNAAPNPALKIGAFGCGGCGCLFVLGGLVTFGLAAGGAVNSSEVGTAVAGGSVSVFLGLGGLATAIILFALSRKQPTA